MMKIAQNKKARRDYSISEILETGIELQGGEIKSLRAGNCSIDGAFVKIEKGEFFLYGCQIQAFKHSSSWEKHETERPKKLLAHKKEIQKWQELVEAKNYVIVCLNLHWKHQWVKIDIGLAKSKNQQDKRQQLKKETEMREAQREAHCRNKK